MDHLKTFTQFQNSLNEGATPNTGKSIKEIAEPHYMGSKKYSKDLRKTVEEQLERVKDYAIKAGLNYVQKPSNKFGEFYLEIESDGDDRYGANSWNVSYWMKFNLEVEYRYSAMIEGDENGPVGGYKDAYILWNLANSHKAKPEFFSVDSHESPEEFKGEIPRKLRKAIDKTAESL